MYEGTIDGSKVCIKRVRVYIKDDPKITAKVRYVRHRSTCSLSLTKFRRSVKRL